MTPLGQGFFLAPDGAAIPIFEHLMAVEDNPTRFGLRPEDTACQDAHERRDREARRVRVLTLVLKNGFCRVRLHQDRSVVEFHAATPEEEARRRTLITAFLKTRGIRDCVIKNVNGNSRTEGRANP